MSSQSIVYSREERWRHGGSSEGKLNHQSAKIIFKKALKHTQWLLLQYQKDGVDKLNVFCQVVQLILVSTNKIENV